jgi:peptidoglycan/LPS O-acetylase OafA/YrhL
MDTKTLVAAFIGNIILPFIGLVICISGLSRHSLNPRCGLAATLFFIALLIGSNATVLSEMESITDVVRFWGVFSAVVLHIASAIFGIWGLYQMRRRRKWSHGRKRAILSFWLNILMLMGYSVLFYAQCNPALFKKIGS